MNKKVNKIQLIFSLEGKGLVNYNGNRPPKRFLGQMHQNGKLNNNGMFGKENIHIETITDKDGEDKKIEVAKKIVSSGLLRKEICGDENSINADKIMLHPELRVAFLSQDMLIVRGHMATKDKIGVTLKRKSGISVIHAEQTSDTVTWLETRTTEGKRDENSLFNTETCGHIEYESEVKFDIKQLKFISIDDNCDRMAIKESDVPGFSKHINGRYGEGSAVLGNYGTTHKNFIGEQGVLLSDKVVANLVRETVKRILEIDITRAGAYARTSAIKISLGYPGDAINLIAKPKYHTINKIEDYDKLMEDKEIGMDFVEIEPPMIEKLEKKPKEDKK